MVPQAHGPTPTGDGARLPTGAGGPARSARSSFVDPSASTSRSTRSPSKPAVQQPSRPRRAAGRCPARCRAARSRPGRRCRAAARRRAAVTPRTLSNSASSISPRTGPSLCRTDQRPAAGAQLDGRRVTGGRRPRSRRWSRSRERWTAVANPSSQSWPEQVVVGGRQELVGRQRGDQAAERTGEQQRPGAGLLALAGHVDDGELETLLGGGGHDEVAGEQGAARRPQRRLGAPTAAAAPGAARSAGCGRAGRRASTRPSRPRRRAAPGGSDVTSTMTQSSRMMRRRRPRCDASGVSMNGSATRTRTPRSPTNAVQVPRAEEQARQEQRDHQDVDRDVVGEGDDADGAQDREQPPGRSAGPWAASRVRPADFHAAEMRPGTRAGTTDRDFGAPLMVVIPSGRWRSLYGARPEARLTMRTPEEIPADAGSRSAPGTRRRGTAGRSGGRRRPRRRGRPRAAGVPSPRACARAARCRSSRSARPRPSARRGRPTSPATGPTRRVRPGRSGCMRCRNSTSAR